VDVGVGAGGSGTRNKTFVDLGREQLAGWGARVELTLHYLAVCKFNRGPPVARGASPCDLADRLDAVE